jgi:hypothetical protein
MEVRKLRQQALELILHCRRSCVRCDPGEFGASADIFMLTVEYRFNVISALRRPTY